MGVNVLVSTEASDVLSRLPAGERDRLLLDLDDLSDGIPAAAVPVTSGVDRPLYMARLRDRSRVIFSADQPVGEIIVLKAFEKQPVDGGGSGGRSVVMARNDSSPGQSDNQHGRFLTACDIQK